MTRWQIVEPRARPRAAKGHMRLAIQSLAMGLLLSCVEQVTVIDPVGGSPAGAGGSDPGAGGSPATATAAELQAACDAVCARSGCELWHGFCATQCASVIVLGCEAEGLALLNCLANAPEGSCRFGFNACSTQDLGSCANGVGGATGCDDAACVIGAGTCSCSGVCQFDVLTQDCVQQADGTAICTCYSGDKVLNTCESPLTSCQLDTCCG
jgi:hypothetical protein